MKYMLAKTAHFLTDFHSHWFASLNLPMSDDKHNQLKDKDFDALYQRLHTFPSGRGEIGIYSSLFVGHRMYLGRQIVHCTPFASHRSLLRLDIV